MSYIIALSVWNSLQTLHLLLSTDDSFWRAIITECIEQLQLNETLTCGLLQPQNSSSTKTLSACAPHALNKCCNFLHSSLWTLEAECSLFLFFSLLHILQHATVMFLDQFNTFDLRILRFVCICMLGTMLWHVSWPPNEYLHTVFIGRFSGVMSLWDVCARRFLENKSEWMRCNEESISRCYYWAINSINYKLRAGRIPVLDVHHRNWWGRNTCSHCYCVWMFKGSLWYAFKADLLQFVRSEVGPLYTAGICSVFLYNHNTTGTDVVFGIFGW